MPESAFPSGRRSGLPGAAGKTSAVLPRLRFCPAKKAAEQGAGAAMVCRQKAGRMPVPGLHAPQCGRSPPKQPPAYRLFRKKAEKNSICFSGGSAQDADPHSPSRKSCGSAASEVRKGHERTRQPGSFPHGIPASAQHSFEHSKPIYGGSEQCHAFN